MILSSILIIKAFKLILRESLSLFYRKQSPVNTQRIQDILAIELAIKQLYEFVPEF